MSSIGGPGGIGGPKGPEGPGATAADGVDDVADASGVRGDSAIEGATAARAAGELEALVGDIAAGKLTAREAVDRLVDDIAGTEQLGATERAELRELLGDLVANDPYLSSLVGRA